MYREKYVLLTVCVTLLLCLAMLFAGIPVAYADKTGDERLSRPVVPHPLTDEEMTQPEESPPQKQLRPEPYLTETERIQNLPYPFEFNVDSIDGDDITVSFMPYFGVRDYALSIAEQESLEEYSRRIESGNYQNPNHQEITGRDQKIVLAIGKDYSFSLRYQEGDIAVSYDGFLSVIKFTARDIEEAAVKTRYVMRNEVNIPEMEARAARYAAVEAMAATDTQNALELGEATNTDVSAVSPWARETIQAAISAGLVPEDLQSSYQQPISRAELTALAIAYVESRTGMDMEVYLAQNGMEIDEASFIDTQDPLILSACALRIIQGVGDGRFDPGGAITREQITAIISRTTLQLFEEDEGFSTNPAAYADRHLASEWALPYIDYVTTKGLMGGVGDNCFDPAGLCTREQGIAIFYRIFVSM